MNMELMTPIINCNENKILLTQQVCHTSWTPTRISAVSERKFVGLIALSESKDPKDLNSMLCIVSVSLNPLEIFSYTFHSYNYCPYQYVHIISQKRIRKANGEVLRVYIEGDSYEN